MANYYYVKNSIKPIPIGFEGENDARTIVFDISRWIEDYGNGSALLVHQRPGDAEPYPVTTAQKAGTVEWTVQQADIIAGAPGRAQISYKVGDNIVARSPIYKTVACASISAAEAGEPGQDWINDVLDAAAQAETAATQAANSAETAKQAETAATQAATSAAADANVAAQSEASANKSASAAAGSATAASDSATAAAGSAETAQTAATTATDAAGQAQASQTAAAGSASAAAESATQAAGSQTAAKNSEDAAAGSATDAAESASAALTSQNAAKTSENNAKSSETQAASSASAAASSATAANQSKTDAESAKTAAEAAKTAAETAQSAAEAAQTAAESAKTAAASSASAAADSATSAQAHATTAQQAAETATSAAKTAAQDAADAVSEQLKEDVQGIVDNLDGLSEAIAIKETATGEVISVSDSADYRLLGLKLYGKSVQDGTPTPEAPVEIESVMNPTVVVAPKNLIDYAEWNKVGVQNGTGIWRDFGIVITSGEGGDAYTRYYQITGQGYKINVIPGITYKLSWEHTGSGGTVYIFPNGTSTGMVSIYTGAASSLSYTAKEGDSYIMFRVGVRDANATATYKNVMLSIDSDTTFVPYGGDAQTFTYPTPNGLPGIPVDSGGNYTDVDGQQWICDEVDFGRGKYVQRVKKEELTGTPNFNVTTDIDAERFRWGSCLTNIYKDGSNLSLSNFATFQRWSTGTSNHPIFAVSEKDVYFKPTASTTAEEVNAMFTQMIASENPPYIVGQLETPIETDLTPEQLAAYAALTTYKPNTTVTTDSSPAAGVSVNYVADTKTYIDNKIASISEAIVGGNN